MKYDILNRFTGAVQFTAEIDCADDTPASIKIGLAVRVAIKADANLADADLVGANLAYANLADANLARANLADADLADANLAGANLVGANLAYANLADADLADANLARANLADADLVGANLAYANLAYANLAYANLADADLADANLADADLGKGRFWVDGGSDRRGFRFHALVENDAVTIRAGCRRWSTFTEARAHFGDGYRSDGDRSECLARLALMEAQVEARRALTAEAA